MSASGEPRSFIDRHWGYVAQKDGMIRFVLFHFDKNNNRFVVILSDILPLSNILK